MRFEIETSDFSLSQEKLAVRLLGFVKLTSAPIRIYGFNLRSRGKGSEPLVIPISAESSKYALFSTRISYLTRIFVDIKGY
jgi:hypothetical protein